MFAPGEFPEEKQMRCRRRPCCRDASRTTLYLSTLAFCLWLPSSASAQYDLGWYTIDGGGWTFSSGESYSLGGTIGQPDANVVVMTGGTFELVGGFWAGAAVGPPPCPGDFNCDGVIDFNDIDRFVAVLSGGECCDGTGHNCDVNSDGLVNFDDIDPFVALLTSGATCP